MKAITYSQKYLKNILTKEKVGIDMTCGNGNDTRFLADHLKLVYSIDIQKEAILKTQDKLKDYQNIIYINDNHENIAKYINHKIDVVMFNLGYLPYSDQSIITNSLSTIKALESIYNLLNDKAIISLLIYRGHNGGMQEYHDILKYLKTSKYHILESYLTYTSLFEPILYLLTK